MPIPQQKQTEPKKPTADKPIYEQPTMDPEIIYSTVLRDLAAGLPPSHNPLARQIIEGSSQAEESGLSFLQRPEHAPTKQAAIDITSQAIDTQNAMEPDALNVAKPATQKEMLYQSIIEHHQSQVERRAQKQELGNILDVGGMATVVAGALTGFLPLSLVGLGMTGKGASLLGEVEREEAQERDALMEHLFPPTDRTGLAGHREKEWWDNWVSDNFAGQTPSELQLRAAMKNARAPDWVIDEIAPARGGREVRRDVRETAQEGAIEQATSSAVSNIQTKFKNSAAGKGPVGDYKNVLRGGFSDMKTSMEKDGAFDAMLATELQAQGAIQASQDQKNLMLDALVHLPIKRMEDGTFEKQPPMTLKQLEDKYRDYRAGTIDDEIRRMHYTTAVDFAANALEIEPERMYDEVFITETETEESPLAKALIGERQERVTRTELVNEFIEKVIDEFEWKQREDGKHYAVLKRETGFLRHFAPLHARPATKLWYSILTGPGLESSPNSVEGKRIFKQQLEGAFSNPMNFDPEFHRMFIKFLETIRE